jgi:hypothetical protein
MIFKVHGGFVEFGDSDSASVRRLSRRTVTSLSTIGFSTSKFATIALSPSMAARSSCSESFGHLRESVLLALERLFAWPSWSDSESETSAE